METASTHLLAHQIMNNLLKTFRKVNYSLIMQQASYLKSSFCAQSHEKLMKMSVVELKELKDLFEEEKAHFLKNLKKVVADEEDAEVIFNETTLAIVTSCLAKLYDHKVGAELDKFLSDAETHFAGVDF